MKTELTLEQYENELKRESDKKKEEMEIIEQIVDIVNTLVEARVDAGLSQDALAKECGLKQSAIARFENLGSIPRLDTVVTIAQNLGFKIKADREIKKNNMISSEFMRAVLLKKSSCKYSSFTQNPPKTNDDELSVTKNTVSLEVMPA